MSYEKSIPIINIVNSIDRKKRMNEKSLQFKFKFIIYFRTKAYIIDKNISYGFMK